MADAMPRVQPALQTGDAFFNSNKRKWTDDSLGVPPFGAWQLAPNGLSNGFAIGGDVYGEAVYSPQDRNLVSTSAPIVSGLLCKAKDKASQRVEEMDIVVITNTGSRLSRVHTLQKASVQNISNGGAIAVVAAYHHLGVSPSDAGTSVSLICCGQIKLRVKDVEKLVPGFNGENHLPGDKFEIGNKTFIILTPVSKLTHDMRCMMDSSI